MQEQKEAGRSKEAAELSCNASNRVPVGARLAPPRIDAGNEAAFPARVSLAVADADTTAG